MTGRLRTSQDGLDLIKSFEGFRDTAVRLPDGRWTIGHGHVKTAREGLKVSETDAEDLLRRDIAPAEEIVGTAVFAPVSQNQFDALVSLAFNISPLQFRDSDILQALNAGDYISAADGFDEWRSARVYGRLIVVDALVRRRALEKALFLEHPAGRPIAPTPVVIPERTTPERITPDRPAAERPAASARPASSAAASRPQSTFQAANDMAHEDVAEAIRKLAEQVAIQDRAEAVETSADNDAAPETGSSDQRPVDDARRVVAERLKRILDRTDAAIAQHQQTSAPVEPSPATASPQKAPEARPVVLEGLPDFDAPFENSQPVRNGNGRKLIDDTETFDPGRDPSELFAEAQREARRQEKLANGRNGAKRDGLRMDGPVGRLAPWLAVLILSGLGVAVAFAEMFGGARPGQSAGAPTVFAVFGLMLVMSLYFISTRRRDLDS